MAIAGTRSRLRFVLASRFRVVLVLLKTYGTVALSNGQMPCRRWTAELAAGCNRPMRKDLRRMSFGNAQPPSPPRRGRSAQRGLHSAAMDCRFRWGRSPRRRGSRRLASGPEIPHIVDASLRDAVPLAERAAYDERLPPWERPDYMILSSRAGLPSSEPLGKTLPRAIDYLPRSLVATWCGGPLRGSWVPCFKSNIPTNVPGAVWSPWPSWVR